MAVLNESRSHRVRVGSDYDAQGKSVVEDSEHFHQRGVRATCLAKRADAMVFARKRLEPLWSDRHLCDEQRLERCAAAQKEAGSVGGIDTAHENRAGRV